MENLSDNDAGKKNVEVRNKTCDNFCQTEVIVTNACQTQTNTIPKVNSYCQSEDISKRDATSQTEEFKRNDNSSQTEARPKKNSISTQTSNSKIIKIVKEVELVDLTIDEIKSEKNYNSTPDIE